MDFGILKSNVTIAQDNGEWHLIHSVFKAPVSIQSKRVNTGSDTLNLGIRTTTSQAQRWEITAGLFSPYDDLTDFFLHNVTRDVSSKIFVRPPLPIKRFKTAVGLSDEHVPGFYSYTGSSVGRPESNMLAFSKGSGVYTNMGTPGASLSRGSSFLGKVTLATASAALRGDFIRFSNSPKVYVMTAVTALSNTEANIAIFPPLLLDLPNATTCFFGIKATMTMRFSLDRIAGMTYVDGIMADPGEIKLIEDIT